MSTWAIVGIIVLVLAIIASNLLLLKHSANSKFSSHLSEANKRKGFDDDEEDSW